MTNNSRQKSLVNIENKILKPIIKWAGGKTRLKGELLKTVEIASGSMKVKKINYYEPFFGGGALFFELYRHDMIDKAYINDIIPHLVLFYEVIAKKEWLEDLFSEIESLAIKFEQEDKKQVYGSAKENSGWVKEFNELWINKLPKTKREKIKSAALFFVLNKTGFNGMFRLNKDGKFNIPKGDTNKINFDDKVRDNFKQVSSILSTTSIHCGSYEKILPPENKIDKHTSFIYLDPPYIPDSRTADFTDYSKEGFKEEDHKKVANIFHQLAEDGYKVVLSNNANNASKEMYAENKKVFAYEINVSRAIAKTKEGKRPPSKELLVSSFNIDSLGMKRV